MGLSLSGVLSGGLSGFMAGGPIGALAGGVLGGVLGGKADDAREDALNAANRSSQAGFAQSRKDLLEARGRMEGYTEPFREFGAEGFDPYRNAMGRYENLLQGKFDYKQSPGYQFRLREGLKSIGIADGEANQRNLSGSQLKALSGYNQNFASLDYGNEYNRYQGTLDRYMGGAQNQIGVGERANLAMGGYDQNVANQLSQQAISSGNVRAGRDLALGQNKASGIESILGTLSTAGMAFGGGLFGGGTGGGGPGAGGEGGMLAGLNIF